MSPEEVRRATAVLARHEMQLMKVPGVIGVGIGATEQGDRAAIHVYVNAKAMGEKVPAAFPQQIENIPVKVIHTDDIRAR